MTDLYELAAIEAREMVAARYRGGEDQCPPVFNALLGVKATLKELRRIGLVFDVHGPFTIPHDGFVGDPIGAYVTREGKKGVVLQQIGTQVVHVYGRKWIDGQS